MQYNKGVIVGVTRTSDGEPMGNCLLRFYGIQKNRNWLEITDNRGCKLTQYNMLKSDKNGRFQIKFLWQRADFAEFGDKPRAVIWALGPEGSRLKGDNSEPVYIAPNIGSMVTSILPSSLGPTDAAGMAGYKLPGAFSSMLTPRLSVGDYVAASICDVWLE
ncbi:MAG: hypothetical protein ABJK37_14670 [Paraglaciecola sp.]|uniref:hypothetical protein n=1 Tax=Paraglaciecola sp. TaxID=1920173 RepID=UPI003298B910